VTQRGSVTARKDRSEPAALARQRGVADGVDAAVEAMEAAPSRPLLHGPRAHPERPQLGERHDTMLASRQLRNGHIEGGWAEKANYVFVFSAHPLNVANPVPPGTPGSSRIT
jgi:hypothetical protein